MLAAGMCGLNFQRQKNFIFLLKNEVLAEIFSAG